MSIAEDTNIRRQSRISNALMTTRSTYRRRETRVAATHALRNSLQCAATEIVTELLPKEKFAARRLTLNL
jgi:hypothetical protein